MLPFARFPLTINFLTAEYHKYLEKCPKPPLHMKVQVASSHEFTLCVSSLLWSVPFADRVSTSAWKGRQKVRELPQNDLDLAIMCDVCQDILPRDDDPNCAAECECFR